MRQLPYYWQIVYFTKKNILILMNGIANDVIFAFKELTMFIQRTYSCKQSLRLIHKTNNLNSF